MNNENDNNQNDSTSTEPSPFDLPTHLPPAPQLPQQHGQAEAPIHEEPQSPLLM
jgi:hypothetical protein